MITEQNGNLDLVSAALVAVQGELEAASFDSQNPFLRNRYASLGAIIETSRPILAKHKLAVQQVPTTTADGKLAVTTIIRHASGQWLDGGTLALAIGDEKGKSLAQVAGSICTYLKRYAWASNLGMYADEDSDGESGERVKPVKRAPEAPRQADQLKPLLDATSPPESAPEAKPEPLKATPDRPKLRMATLNRLLAAPGQPNRALVTNFLFARGWIKHDELPENWPVFTLPKDKEALDRLMGEVQDFERQMRAEPTPGEEEAHQTP